MSSSRSLCFTHNNYTEEDIEKWQNWDMIKYIVIGFEICPSTGTPHLQGYVEFRNSVKFTTLKNKFPTVHFEKRRKTAAQAAEYCKKSKTKDINYEHITDKKGNKCVWEKGDISSQGARTDISDAIDIIIDGGKLNDVYPETRIKYEKGLKSFAESLQKDRDFKPEVIWIYGLSGTGKTKKATEYSKEYYIKDGTQWWDNYEHEETIIIDDFDGRWPYRDLLRLLDRYKYQGQIKGGYCKINSKRIVITCEHHPDNFWDGNELTQVVRRLSEIIHLKAEAAAVAEVPGNTNAGTSEAMS